MEFDCRRARARPLIPLIRRSFNPRLLSITLHDSLPGGNSKKRIFIPLFISQPFRNIPSNRSIIRLPASIVQSQWKRTANLWLVAPEIARITSSIVLSPTFFY